MPTEKQLVVLEHETASRLPYCAPATDGTTDHAGVALAGVAAAITNAVAKPTLIRTTLRTIARVISDITIEAARADITVETVDAIVNAANASLRRGGGV